MGLANATVEGIYCLMELGAKGRVKKRGRLVIMSLLLLCLGAVGAIGFWFGWGEREISEPPAVVKRVLQSQETHDAVLYFADSQTMQLMPEHRAIPVREGPGERALELMRALLQGPRNGGTPTLPPLTQVRALYVTADHTAVVDLSREVTRNHPGGVNAELLTIFSIVKTLTRNVPQIQRVKLLVEGAEIETLAGHVSCGQPFSVTPAWMEAQS